MGVPLGNNFVHGKITSPIQLCNSLTIFRFYDHGASPESETVISQVCTNDVISPAKHDIPPQNCHNS